MCTGLPPQLYQNSCQNNTLSSIPSLLTPLRSPANASSLTFFSELYPVLSFRGQAISHLQCQKFDFYYLTFDTLSTRVGTQYANRMTVWPSRLLDCLTFYIHEQLHFLPQVVLFLFPLGFQYVILSPFQVSIAAFLQAKTWSF